MADLDQNGDRRTIVPLPTVGAKVSAHTSSEAPYYGLKILNRNDPENFSIGITPDDDIEMSDEFIIYRPQHAGTTPHAHVQMMQTVKSLIFMESGSLSRPNSSS